MRIISMICILLLVQLGLSGCTSDEELWQKSLQEGSAEASAEVNRLIGQVKGQSIRNVKLLNAYADVVKKESPDLKEIVETLATDATANGPIVKGLKERQESANKGIVQAVKGGEQEVLQLQQEFSAIQVAADPALFGMMLTDPINVLADMSNGKLARVEAMSKEATLQANQSGDYGAGSQLVGNPNYGQWRGDGHGRSFWEWYGMYSLFSNMFRSPIYYGGWAGNRGYSYYSDHGRNYYTSPSARKGQETQAAKTRQKFQKNGKSFRSPYAKTRVGASASAKRSSVKSANKFSSKKRGSFKTPSKFAGKTSRFNQSSARSSFSRTSRSFSGGK
ncbi:MAG: hypothetical protein KZQ99_11320 [Candidatus Thiodiazotropha sp. (ex Dulcina madagascariensis)]|nr:hypothetical protein [Candidatus Thiodiazotropha sp. (ex Dulcina madagascariensis)]